MHKSSHDRVSDRILHRAKLDSHHEPAPARLVELIRLRVAEIHDCTDSMKRHREQLEKMGETTGRLLFLGTWENSDLFDSQEKAALAFCEKITTDPGNPLPASLVEEMLHHFTKGETVNLTLAILSANEWHEQPGAGSS